MQHKHTLPKTPHIPMAVFLMLALLIVLLGRDMIPITDSAFRFHDMTQYARVMQYTKEIKSFHIPPTFARDMNFGVGYPIFMFYAPAAYVVASTFNIFGLSVIDSVMLAFFAFWLLGASGMYFLLRSRYDEHLVAIFGAALYSTSPWWASEIFVRGNLATCAFLAFAPWALWSVHEHQRHPVASFIFIMTSTIAHNALSLIFVPILIGYAYFIKKSGRPKRTVAVIVAVLASSWFWIPAIINLPSTYAKEVATMIKYHDHFLCLEQIWSAGFWGYGASLPGCSDGMSFMLGKVQITAFIAGTILTIIKTTKSKSVIYFEVLVVLWLVFMTLSDSKIIWEMLPFIHVIQFPWRLLAITLPFLAIGGGYFLGQAASTSGDIADKMLSKYVDVVNIKYIVAIVLLVFLAFGSSKFFVGQNVSKDEIQAKYLSASYISRSAAFEAPEYLPRSVNRAFWLQYRDKSMPEDQKSILASQVAKYSPNPTHYLIGYLISGISISFVLWQSHTKKTHS